MVIGCVSEIKIHEYRVGLTPENAHAYTSHGHRVLIQKGAGEGSGFTDQEYIGMGAEILPNAQADCRCLSP